MAIAAVAHVYVFPAEPYRFQPVSERGRVTTEETKDILKLEGDDYTPSVVEQKETHIQSPGTSVTESVQDIFISGGEHVSFLFLLCIWYGSRVTKSYKVQDGNDFLIS